MPDPKDKGKTLWVSSGYGHKFREPFVNIAMPGGEFVQLDVEGARHHAQAVLQVAEAAVQDAFIMEWAIEKFGLSDEQAGLLLNDYRQWREKRSL